MSKFTVAAATIQTLSMTAMEEASRRGQRTAGVEDLFLALVLTEQIAGQVLRGLGITLDAARAAVEAQHAAQLALLGIAATAPTEGKIVFHETGGYEWDDRAGEVLKRAVSGKRNGDAAAVLRELLTEPSGLIEAVLNRLGTTPDAVAERLDEVERALSHTESTAGPNLLTRSAAVFVPAPGPRVWELLTDPQRIPEWDQAIGHVEAGEPGASCWDARARIQKPDGQPLRVKPELLAQRLELVRAQERRLVQWRLRYPDAPKANTRLFTAELEPAAGGTQLRLSLEWTRNATRRAGVGRLFRPLLRYLLWLQLTQLGSGISRALR